ncbi:phospholipid-transporting ATPase ABCA1 [Spodoptera frugiperda]|uniref:Phospholipid-transporting ATPase ABCA1 n=1 Tax=Spodoptera frugiperda TaxID=7108 RepID=A0A9R0CXD7_SPOFR|nr:phospholipid-transporting ATPase ABCA1 [Spodoptera frugiperda]XP_035432454.1 phospholipid-transporting ATPase ABCA1 [Spodoptera frugiperda]XP_035432455.1 phospholipid-transporting ATPase ABCA1 [Spodoptera frugiperda]XP_035432456.1 phospholipid-transporting ATPase ABCA1 [Spodoptera frugiperda]XP_050560908.1 phospholipid-transporting ATPase ABCA1 [Spodoptera frugiperda]
MRLVPKQASPFAKFRLLMWKNFLQQWRHRTQTVLEILLPVLTMTLVLILRWQIEPAERETQTYPPFRANTLNFSTVVLFGLDCPNVSIAYSPTSPVLEDVVRNAITNLLIQNMEDLIARLPIEIELPPTIEINSTAILDWIKSRIRVQAYNNSNETRGIYIEEENTRRVIAVVEFDDKLYGAESLSNNLSYSLRFPERPRLNSLFQTGGRTWRTDAVFPVFETPGPRFSKSWEGGNDPGYVNEMFIALQQVISTELIARSTGVNMSEFTVFLQRYPHPPYIRDMALDLLQFMFPMFIMLSFSYTAINITRAVTVEKELQLKETMKIMGLPTWLHWTAWTCKQFVFLLVSASLTVILLKINWFTNEDGFSEYTVFTNTPWTVLMFFTMLYLTCVIFFSFMMSSFFSKASTAALCTVVVWFLTYIPAFLLAMDIEMSTTVQVFTCLSINSAMSYGFQLLLAKESTGGLQWGDFMSAPGTDSNRFVFGHVVIMLVVDCFVYMLVTLYFEQVMPGPFGTPKRWYFPFQLRFWFPHYKPGTVLVLENENSEFEDIIKEKEPNEHEVGVKMNNLTKIFGANTAVNNLSLNIYDDQITVLLGHNGAGKSTTISMLTGNLEVTRGTVTVAGYDMTHETYAARAHIGLCPQHNVLFNELTVREHLEFFARLKGFRGAELKSEIDTLIEKLELQDKRDYPSNGLSGGQKRRLCVGIALSGAARVVLLDEPTSGMDPSSRRALWELLQKEKKGRSMILTTHFMDEADILGDRVAIMAQGRLQCVGSPYFLKRHYGVGYTLVVVKDDDFDFEECTRLINKYIPDTVVKEDRGTEITYNLINDYSYAFEEMLNDLECNMEKIKYKNYGLTATTLEDVFMSVGSDLAPVNNSDNDDAVTTTTDSTIDDILKHELDSSLEELDRDESSVTGFRLLCQQVLAVWMKKGLTLIRSPWLMILQFFAPVILINATLGVMRYVMSLTPTIRSRFLSLTEGFTSTETLLSFNGTLGSSVGAIAAAAYEMMFTASDVENMGVTHIGNVPMDEYYLNRTMDPVVMGQLRHQILIGSTFDDNNATLWFSNFGYHDVAIALSTFHSAFLRAFNSTAQLNVYNHPLEATYRDQTDMQMMIAMLSMQLSSGIGSSVSIVSAVFIMFFIKERTSGAKLLQKAAGVQPAVLWGSAAVFNWAWFLITCVSIVITCAAFQVIGLSTAQELARMYLCVMLYGAAMLPLVYILSFAFNGPAVGFVGYYFMNVLFGMMGAQIVEALSSPQLNTAEAANILDYILQFFPLYSLITAVRFLNQVGLREYTCLQMCEYYQAVSPNLQCTMESLCSRNEECCVEPNVYFKWNQPGVSRYLTSMIISCIVFWTILMIIEYRVFQKLCTIKKTPPPLDESILDEDVQKEAQRARNVLPSQRYEHALIANDLSKYYGKHLAVNQISFGVNDGECFGLLGVNGAGKTTTFKMLMGDESISSGEAFVSGHSVEKSLGKVHQNIGYCPQFDALFGELTGRETLHMFAMMKGLRLRSAAPTAETLAHALGFLKHLDKRVNQYSGGTKRKLNTAIAFLGRTRLVFVDEPTTGVDPAAKRHVWRATRGVQRAGRGVVLTSHSMEECEALCSRLTIMVNGRFQCFGTPQHLKNKFSEGFTLIIKMKMEDRDNDTASINSSRSVVDTVKEYVTQNFQNPRIMEEYQGLLTYYLPDRSMAWSRMFGIMERAKRDLEIEDYSISQTTLEQIFLQFTKYQRQAFELL